MNADFGSWLLGMSLDASALGGMLGMAIGIFIVLAATTFDSALIYWKARIEHAKMLLAEQGASVTEAGLSTGFGEIRAFSRAFKHITLQSPSKYRRSC
jgi:AraC-like DNA-binding protein